MEGPEAEKRAEQALRETRKRQGDPRERKTERGGDERARCRSRRDPAEQTEPLNLGVVFEVSDNMLPKGRR